MVCSPLRDMGPAPCPWVMPGSRHATKLKAIAARTYRHPRKYYCVRTVYISITYRFASTVNVEEEKLTNTTKSRIALF